MDVDVALDRLAADPSAPLDVAELALHLARDEHPDLNIAYYLDCLTDLGRQAHGAHVRRLGTTRRRAEPIPVR